MNSKWNPVLLAGAMLVVCLLAGCGGGSSGSGGALVQGSVLVHDSGNGTTELLGFTWDTGCITDPFTSNYFRETLQFASTGTADSYNEFTSNDSGCTSPTTTKNELLFITTAGDKSALDNNQGSITATRLNVSGSSHGSFAAIGYVVLGVASPDRLYVSDDSAPLEGDGYPGQVQSFGRLRQP